MTCLCPQAHPRYLCLRAASSSTHDVFLSTCPPALPVLYCYELLLAPLMTCLSLRAASSSTHDVFVSHAHVLYCSASSSTHDVFVSTGPPALPVLYCYELLLAPLMTTCPPALPVLYCYELLLAPLMTCLCPHAHPRYLSCIATSCF